jgi:hypothetical protein
MGWIRVDVIRPEVNKSVLVYHERTRKISTAVYNGKRWLTGNIGLYDDITHWMPLPEPPKFNVK